MKIDIIKLMNPDTVYIVMNLILALVKRVKDIELIINKEIPIFHIKKYLQ